MNIKTVQFCNISTSPKWQIWLHRFDVDLYRSFMIRLRGSKGCNDNSNIMLDVLQHIVSKARGKELEDFLRSNFPQAVYDNAKDPIFGEYFPNIISFPRRLILDAKQSKEFHDFVVDKICVDSVQYDGKIYVEYLCKSDINIQNKIQPSNWLIKKWRAKYGKD